MMGFIVAGGRIVEIDTIVDSRCIATLAGAPLAKRAQPGIRRLILGQPVRLPEQGHGSNMDR
jgi:hypothetical protein